MTDTADERQPLVSPNVVTGIGVILLGVALLLERFRVLDARTLLQLWPLLLILLGLHLVVQAIWSQRAPAGAGGDSGTGGIWILVVAGTAPCRLSGRRYGCECHDAARGDGPGSPREGGS